MAFYLSSCAQETGTVSKPPGLQISSNIKEDETAPKEAWESRWEELLKAGKKEGRVVIYTTQTSNEMRQAMTKAVFDKYGIKLDIVVGKGAEIAPKIFSERNAKIYLVDLYFGGPSTPLNLLKPKGILEPLEPVLILPEVIDSQYWVGGKLGWVDKEHYLIGFFGSVTPPIAINTLLVKPEEMRSYYDLLNPRWKGRILMNDPTTQGTGSSGFYVLGWHILNPDFFHQLTRQEPVVMRDRRLQVEWLAHGKYAIQVFPAASIIEEFKEAGAPLDVLTPREGGYLGSGGGMIALLKDAPHSNAARVLINWLLSREGQTVICNAKGAQSLRVDVKVERLRLGEVRLEGMKYFLDVSTEEAIIEEFEKMKIAEKIFAPFIVK